MMVKEKQLYLITAERLAGKNKASEKSESVEYFRGKPWEFMAIPPLPSWYPQAKEVLSRAIEVYPRESGFNLFFDNKNRTICLYSTDSKYRREMERLVHNFIRDKREKEKAQRNASLSIGDISKCFKH